MGHSKLPSPIVEKSHRRLRAGIAGVGRTDSGDLNVMMFCSEQRMKSYIHEDKKKKSKKSKRGGKRSRPPPSRSKSLTSILNTGERKEAKSGDKLDLSKKTPSTFLLLRENTNRRLVRHHSAKSLVGLTTDNSLHDDEDEDHFAKEGDTQTFASSLVTTSSHPFVLYYCPLLALQSKVRTWLGRRRYLKVKAAAIRLQAHFRGYYARQRRELLPLLAQLQRIEDQRCKDLEEIDLQKKSFYERKERQRRKRAKKNAQRLEKKERFMAEKKALRSENKALREEGQLIKESILSLAKEQERLVDVNEALQENLESLKAYIAFLEQEIDDAQFVCKTFEEEIKRTEMTLAQSIEESMVEKRMRILFRDTVDCLLVASKAYCNDRKGHGTACSKIVSQQQAEDLCPSECVMR